MRQREELLKTWLDMWLGQELLPLDAVFTQDVEYLEFQGRKYCGTEQIRRWFTEWNSQNHVTHWQVCRMIHDQNITMMEFEFQSENLSGETRAFIWLNGTATTAYKNCKNFIANCLTKHLICHKQKRRIQSILLFSILCLFLFPNMIQSLYNKPLLPFDNLILCQIVQHHFHL